MVTPELKMALKDVEMHIQDLPTETQEHSDAILAAFTVLEFLCYVPNPRIDS